jgi:hypothetical protein
LYVRFIASLYADSTSDAIRASEKTVADVYLSLHMVKIHADVQLRGDMQELRPFNYDEVL